METPNPQFIENLNALKKMLVAFIKTYQNLDSKKERKKHRTKAKDCATLLKVITPIIKNATINVTPNCPPEDIPASVTKHDTAKGIQILNSKIKVIKKYKEDYENYLLNCFGIQLGWKNGLPSPNVGRKFSFRKENNRLIIYTRQSEKDPSIGETQMRTKLRRYRRLENTIRTTLVDENANSSLTEEIDLERLIELEELLKEEPGGLNDIYDKIIKDPELKQQYKKVIERIRKDWEDDGRMTALKEKIEKRLKQTTEREQDSPCPDEEPEPKEEHERIY